MLVILRLDNSSQFWHHAPLRHPRNPPGCFGAFFPVFSSPCHRQDDQGGIFKAQEELPHNLLHRFCSIAKAELPPELCHDHSAVTLRLQKSLWICVSRAVTSEIPESQNILSWKGPKGWSKSSSWSCRGHPNNPPCACGGIHTKSYTRLRNCS